ncbi:MAG: AraC family transcriptional regulator [Microcoleus sp. SIO2G3]|nr:AraC family transcriptional regulator [Microcoleus sp. SIO2G3]
MLPPYKEFAPPNSIAHAVDAFWCFSSSRPSAQSKDSLHHRVLPDGCMDLIFCFQHSASNAGISNPSLIIHGPTDRFNLVDIKPTTEFVGVRFKPGMAGVFLDLSPLGLFQQEIRVQDCLSNLVPLFDQLCNCGSTEEALSILQRTMLELQKVGCRYDIPLWSHKALSLISTSYGQMPVSRVAETVGVSERTLRRGITAAVGFPPKVLARILRFQRVITLLRSQDTPDLCSIAFESGYADQAHMGREFQEFSGLTPTAFIE